MADTVHDGMCPECKEWMRWDDHLRVVNVPQGAGTVEMHVCGLCQARINGTPDPVVKTYPPGSPVPLREDQRPLVVNIPICGLCRRARMRNEPERNTIMRLRPGVEGHAAGHYDACKECIEHWRPQILAWLQEEDILGPEAPLDLVAGDLLL